MAAFAVLVGGAAVALPRVLDRARDSAFTGGAAALPAVTGGYDAVWFEWGVGDGSSRRIAARRGTEPPVYVPWSGHYYNPDLARDGRHLANVVPGVGLQVLELPSPEVRTIAVPEDADDPVWSPDARSIVMTPDFTVPGRPGGGRPQRLYVVDVESGTVRTIPYRYGGGVASWAPDGRTLVVNGARGRGGVDFVTTNGVVRRTLPRYTIVSRHPWSPDGSRLVLGDLAGERMVVVDVATGDVLSSIKPEPDYVWTYADELADTEMYNNEGQVRRTRADGTRLPMTSVRHAARGVSAGGLTLRPAV